MNDFKEKYKFDPNNASKEIFKEQLVTLSNLVSGTPQEELIAFKDPKVQELVDYIMAAIIIENQRINGSDTFPIQIYRRYKSEESLKSKMEDWSKRDDKQGKTISDYLGFKIIPEAEHSIFYSTDSVLQGMISKREEVRAFIANMYNELSENQTMTFKQYSQKCRKVIRQLISIFPVEATARKSYYKSLLKTLNTDHKNYNDFLEDPNVPLTLEEILDLTTVNIKKLLSELTFQYPNEVILYKLKSDLMNTFQSSDMLKYLGLSISSDENRTKSKKTPNGYRSEFIGLNLNIKLNDGKSICLPIECQIQTIEQYKDGNSGFSAHTKLPGKNLKLKSIPSTVAGKKYSDPQGHLKEYKDFLSHIMNVSPSCAIAKSTGSDFAAERVSIVTYDLYEAFRLISRVPKDSIYFKIHYKYFAELYAKRKELFPTDDSLLPLYLTRDEIPNPQLDYNKYTNFFAELRDSLSKTLGMCKKDNDPSISNDKENFSK